MPRTTKPRQSRTIGDFLAKLDAAAASEACGAYEVYHSYNFILTVWFEASGVPVPALNPENTPELRPLHRVAMKFGRTLLNAVRDREMAAWNAQQAAA